MKWLHLVCLNVSLLSIQHEIGILEVGKMFYSTKNEIRFLPFVNLN